MTKIEGKVWLKVDTKIRYYLTNINQVRKFALYKRLDLSQHRSLKTFGKIFCAIASF